MFPPGACSLLHTPPDSPLQAESETATGLPGTDERFQLLSRLEQQGGPPGRKKGGGG